MKLERRKTSSVVTFATHRHVELLANARRALEDWKIAAEAHAMVTDCQLLHLVQSKWVVVLLVATVTVRTSLTPSRGTTEVVSTKHVIPIHSQELDD